MRVPSLHPSRYPLSEMGFTLTAFASGNLLNLQSYSALSAFKLHSHFSLCRLSSCRTKPIQRHSPFIHASSNSSAESSNGAVITAAKPDTAYGRLYFPLAAVVGQV